MNPVKRSLRLLRRARKRLGVSFARLAALASASVTSGLAEAGALVMVVQIAVAIAGDDEVEMVSLGPVELHFGTGTLFVIAFTLMITKFVTDVLAAVLAARLVADAQSRLRRDIYASFSGASWAVQAAEPEGHLQNVLTQQAGKAAQLLVGITGACIALFSFLALLASALLIDVIAAGTILVAVVGLFFVLRPLSTLAKRYSRDLYRASVAYSKTIGEGVSMMQEVQAFGVAEEMKRRVFGLVDRLHRPFFRAHFTRLFVTRVYRTLAVLLLLAGLAVIRLTGTGELASLGAVVLLLLRALSYTQQLQSSYHQLAESTPYLTEIERTRRAYVVSTPRREGADLGPVQTVAFDSVHFSYVEGQPALQDVTLDACRGEIIGVVGPSGAGKSTLVQMLLRLRRPDAGRLLVNGRPADEYSLESWRRATAFVPQESRLFGGSVEENIDFLRGLEHEVVETAARAAHIHDEITALPDGYETDIGRAGGRLSGGQRQRICLARALAGEPEILILDEPTSALDARSEALIRATLQQRAPDLMTFVIAHRMTTLSICDRIVVLQTGRLEAFGTPEKVAEDNPFYRQAIEFSRLP